MRTLRFAASLVALFALSMLGLAQSFGGSYIGQGAEEQSLLELQQDGSSIKGTYSSFGTKLSISGSVSGSRAKCVAVLDGTPVKFSVEFWFEGSNLIAQVSELDENGRPDPETTERLVFARTGAGPGASGPESLLDSDGLNLVASHVKSNFARDKGSKVLAQGDPPLTLESVAAFADLMKLTFDVDMTEAEFAVTAKHFVQYYTGADAQTKQMLALGWQSILSQIEQKQGADREKSIAEVKAVFADRFASGARAGMPWAVAIEAAIERRTKTVAEYRGEMPSYARQAQMHTQMTEADLEASLEMLYFMWVASGRDASLVTPEAVQQVRMLIVQNFSMFPDEVKLIFANAQQVYSQLRGQWAQAGPDQRMQYAQAFGQALDQLGLTLPSARGSGGSGGGAWDDVAGQTHGEWAASMVQGLAGSSYANAWTGS